MDEIEEILADIDAHRDAIDLDIEDVEILALSGEQLQGVLKHIAWRKTEIERLRKCLAKSSRNDSLGDPHSGSAK